MRLDSERHLIAAAANCRGDFLRAILDLRDGAAGHPFIVQQTSLFGKLEFLGVHLRVRNDPVIRFRDDRGFPVCFNLNHTQTLASLLHRSRVLRLAQTSVLRQTPLR
jgi:hypothetical protein